MELPHYKSSLLILWDKFLIKRRYSWLLSIFLWLALIFPASALDLRVAIKKNARNIRIGSSTTAVIKDNSGKKLGELSAMQPSLAKTKWGRVSLGKVKATELIVEPQDGGYVWIGDRWYRGKTHLRVQGRSLMAINKVDLEDYLYSVVGAEAVASWPIEALKAQAVAARSYALYKRKTSHTNLYDVDSTINTQVYKGLDTEYVTTHEAVNSTAGQILTHNSSVILAAFHSSSGGHTENVEDVWKSNLPYLRGVIDYDHESPVFEWNKDFSSNQFSSLLSSEVSVGTITELIPERVTPQGRVISMKVVGNLGSINLTGKQIRKILDLRSTLFRIQADADQVTIVGRGYGHGLGLSQWGAYHLASQGVDYNQILGHYYQNTKLTNFQ